MRPWDFMPTTLAFDLKGPEPGFSHGTTRPTALPLAFKLRGSCAESVPRPISSVVTTLSEANHQLAHSTATSHHPPSSPRSPLSPDTLSASGISRAARANVRNRKHHSERSDSGNDAPSLTSTLSQRSRVRGAACCRPQNRRTFPTHRRRLDVLEVHVLLVGQLACSVLVDAAGLLAEHHRRCRPVGRASRQ